MDLKKCDECGKSFHQQSGQFSNHLKSEHNLSLKDYIIKYEYGNDPNNLPKCQCGYCDKVTPFYRGKFKKNFAFRKHRSFEWKKEQYIENNGIPKCRCGNDIHEFNRGIPKKFCRGCIDKNDHHRFHDGVFKKGEISGREGMMKKYGVKHPAQLEHLREKQSIRITKYNSDWKKNHTIKRYKDTDLYYQSTFELDFLKLCESKGILYRIKNGNCYNYLNEDSNNGKRLFTDFSMDNFEIEIKSSYILKQQGGLKKLFAKKRAVESTGKKYIFILDKDYSEFEESLL